MGSGQGTGWAGPSWFVVADLILTGLSENHPGLYLTLPDGKTTDKIFAKMSVDDSRQGIHEGGVKVYNARHGTNITLNRAENQANQAFERYLSLTRGRLAIEKTFFCPLHPEQGRNENTREKKRQE